MTHDTPVLTMIREVCALGRAELDRPHTPAGNPAAETTLLAGLQAIDPEGNPSEIALSVPLLAPRAPYFDQLVLDALHRGVAQVVLLGAGYDDRAVRFQQDGVRFFEVDLAHVVNDKQQRLGRLPEDITLPTLIGADLDNDNIAPLLTAAGHNSTQPTLFLAEHLFLFLDPTTIDPLLTNLAGIAASGSSLAVTAEAHPAGLESPDVVAAVDEIMFAGQGPLRSIRTRQTWLDAFAEASWQVQDPDQTTKVDHFTLPTAGGDIPIQTQFITSNR